MRRLHIVCFSLVVAMAALGGCGVRVTVKPPSEPLRSQQTAQWLSVINAKSQAGYWLVSRGYKAIDALIVAATNMPFSHVAVLDPERHEVIEAIGTGVQRTPVKKFLHKTHRILLIKPKWWTAKAGREALANTRALVGKKYDFLGTIGFQSEKRFYCSELGVHVYKAYHANNEHLPRVIEPGQMFLWGSIIYDSGSRD
jgi:hypothetical protein